MGNPSAKEIYNIFVPGIPKAQPRPRMARNGHVYNPKSADEWKQAVMAAFVSQKKPIINTAVSLTISFYLPVPKKEKQSSDYPHTIKPDIDNLIKSVMDALTNAKIWEDDTLVSRITASKWRSRISGALIIITEVL